MAKATWKLVRDKIPEIVENAETKILNDDAYSKALAKKLDEEVKELKHEISAIRNGNGDPAALIEEVCDLLEVTAAVCEFHNIGNDELFIRAEEKRREKGAFQKRVYMKITK